MLNAACRPAAGGGERMRSGSGIGVGIAIGVALGAALGNVGVGIALGVAIGAAIDAGAARRESQPPDSH